METIILTGASFVSMAFNFLASLINGNPTGGIKTPFHRSFNFLASLINGNRINGNIVVNIHAFNFLASLINGNPSRDKPSPLHPCDF